MATDLLVRINATAAGYDAAMAKARASTYKFDTSPVETAAFEIAR